MGPDSYYVVHYPVDKPPTIEIVPYTPGANNFAVAKSWANDKARRHPGSHAEVLYGPLYSTIHNESL